MGGSHRTQARDMHIKGIFDNKNAVAEMIEAYLEYGVDTIIGCLANAPFALDGIKLAQDRTGKRVYYIELAVWDTADNKEARHDAQAVIKNCKNVGVDICIPLHVCVERLLNKQTRKIERIEDYINMIREHDMIPGLSAHDPEVLEVTDENDYDVETYIQIYNAAGFLMQVEVERVHELIHQSKKPVLTIKPLAAGHLNPFVGLTFVWNTLRTKDMVAIGCMTPGEVHEVVEYSLAAIEQRVPVVGGRLHQY